MRLPFPTASAVSTASASRLRIVGPAVSRSTTTSMLCRIWRSSDRSSVSITTLPSTRARTKPCFRKSSNRSRYSPFWPRITGASTANCVFGRQRQDAADDLLAGLGRDRPAALRAVPAADPGVEHAQEVVNLGDRADGRPRIVAGRLLRDRDRRAQAADVVDLGLGHLAQKLPGEGGQTLDVPPLPLGIERVERQRALARAGDAGQADELVARQSHVDAAEVVLAGALDDDIGSGHRCAGAVGREIANLHFMAAATDPQRRRFLPTLLFREHSAENRHIIR